MQFLFTCDLSRSIGMTTLLLKGVGCLLGDNCTKLANVNVLLCSNLKYCSRFVISK